MYGDGIPYPYAYPYPAAEMLFSVVFFLLVVGVAVVVVLTLMGRRASMLDRHTHTETERVVIREVPARPAARAVGRARQASPEWAQTAITEQPTTVTASASDLASQRPAATYRLPQGNRPERVSGPKRKEIGS